MKFVKPTRVWVNAPSSLDSMNKYHGRVGIAHTVINNLGNEITTLYFTHGEVREMNVPTSALEYLNSQNDNLKLNS